MTEPKGKFVATALLIGVLVLLVMFYNQNLLLQRQLTEASASVAKIAGNSEAPTGKLSGRWQTDRVCSHY
jgi:hypothetical protein